MANIDEPSTLKEKPASPYEVTKCEDWDHLVGKLRPLSRGWIFRGQLASWELSTTLERYTPPPLAAKVEQEQRLIAEFARRVDRHLLPGQTIRDGLEQIALMQHYGAPTRLLDFTNSPYVAAYFAFEGFEHDARAVWAVKMAPLRRAAGRLLRKAYPEIEASVKEIAGTSPVIDVIRDLAATLAATGGVKGDDNISFESTVQKNKVPFLLPAEPFRLTERMQVQQGTFLSVGDVRHSAVANLQAMKLSSDTVQKFEIPYDVRAGALEELRLMNITRASLFPGLEGYAQSHRQLLFEESAEERQLKQASAGLRNAILENAK